MTKELYTIGHSHHTLEEFIRLLLLHKIDVVCDVRSAPYSKYAPHFNREALQDTLKRSGMSYVFLGTELGARSDDPNCYVDGKVQYDRLAQTELFKHGLDRVHTGIASYRVALMCSEKDPLTCHRTILVCRQLRSDDLDIKHILPDGQLEPHRQAEERLLQMLQMQPDLFLSYTELVDLAYHKQAEKIAYTLSSDDPGDRLEEAL